MRTHHTSWTTVTAAALLLAACDTSITNPGPLPDEDLNNPLAYNSIVTGARLALARAYGSDAAFGGTLSYWGAAVAFEINPAGSTGSFGIPPIIQTGTLTPQISSGEWSAANQARFVAEDALRRFAEAGARDTLLKARPIQIAEAALYAGYGNRLLGENFCGAVLPIVNADGSLSPGDSTSHTDYFTRAEAHFTTALQTATGITTPADTARARTVRTAAQAARASVRLDLASWGVGGTAMWDAAATDAAAITSNTFAFQLPYSEQDQNQYNYIYWARSNTPYRAHTQWGTFYEQYYRASKTVTAPSGDSRVRWDTTALLGDAAVSKFGGRVPWWPEAKYLLRGSPINLSSGWEMRLIQAERALVGGDAPTAVGFMNPRRTILSLPTYSSVGVSVDSAWALLKLERQLELWLEARRLGDLRRWITNNVPGAYRDGHYRNSSGALVSTPVETMTTPAPGRSLCFPIGQNEHDTNPNIP